MPRLLGKTGRSEGREEPEQSMSAEADDVRLKRHTARRVLEKLGFQTGGAVMGKRRDFTVSEVRRFLSVPNIGAFADGGSSSVRLMNDFAAWTLELSCVYVQNTSLWHEPAYDLRKVCFHSLEPFARKLADPNEAYQRNTKKYAPDENLNMAAYLTLLLMIKALEFAHQCSFLDEEKHACLARPFAVKPAGRDSPLYAHLVGSAERWIVQDKQDRESTERMFSVENGRMAGVVQRYLPEAVFSGVKRHDRSECRLLDHIPDYTHDELEFIVSIPGMRLLVCDVGPGGAVVNRELKGPDFPVGSVAVGSVVFLSISGKPGLAVKVAKALGQFGGWKVDCRIHCVGLAVSGGTLVWENGSFVTTLRIKMKEREAQRQRQKTRATFRDDMTKYRARVDKENSTSKEESCCVL